MQEEMFDMFNVSWIVLVFGCLLKLHGFLMTKYQTDGRFSMISDLILIEDRLVIL